MASKTRAFECGLGPHRGKRRDGAGAVRRAPQRRGHLRGARSAGAKFTDGTGRRKSWVSLRGSTMVGKRFSLTVAVIAEARSQLDRRLSP